MHTDNPDIKSLIQDISLLVQREFGQRCIAVYIMGSLARGGFSEFASDIDIGIVVSEIVPDISADLSAIIDSVSTCYPAITNNISIFWGSVESINGEDKGGRYPPFDRLDLILHGKLLYGIDMREQLVLPSQQALETQSALFALDYLANRKRVNEFHQVKDIINQGVVYVTKTVLFPARFIYLAQTGLIAGNDISKHHYIEHFAGHDAMLVAQAYAWRVNNLPSDLSEVSDCLKLGLIPLYRNFIKIYVQKMTAYNELDIVKDLQAWDDLLVGKQLKISAIESSD